jgi:GAF domain-containing protein
VGELRALGEVSQAVNSTLDLETVLSTIVTKAVQLSGTEAGAIYVYDEVKSEFELQSTYGMSEELIAAIKEHRVGVGVGADDPVGKAYAMRAMVQIHDLREEAKTPVLEFVLQAGYRALLVVPLVGPESVVGSYGARRRASSPSRPPIFSRPSQPSRCSRSRTHTCSRRLARRATSSKWRANTSRSSSPT